LGLAACHSQANASDHTGILGSWITESGNVEINIAPCGQKLCGLVSRVLANHSMSDPRVASTAPPATVGMRILTELKSEDSRTWKGRIYNRENGKTYDCTLTPLSTQQLQVHAYIWISMFGRTQTWRRSGND
jgi:uncharacterized protein (DUF2147 family)